MLFRSRRVEPGHAHLQAPRGRQEEPRADVDADEARAVGCLHGGRGLGPVEAGDVDAADGHAGGDDGGRSGVRGVDGLEATMSEHYTCECGETVDPKGEIMHQINPKQVIEAALFVGGQPLTAKKLCYVLRGDFDLDFIEQTIDELNHQYLEEERPYEIRLGEGGYRFVLHDEFQRLRNRVYGIGPREVKLSQDVLEVLALVAYRQPMTQADIEGLGKSNPGPSLRQLLRRELISLERDPQDRKNVKYRTTRRFLSVFGLGRLDELPQADELMFK